MLENVLGKLINGAAWGLGAAVVMAVARTGGGNVRPVGKLLMKGYVAVADRVGEMTAEARENIEDLYHEATVERAQEARMPGNGQASTSRPRTTV